MKKALLGLVLLSFFVAGTNLMKATAGEKEQVQPVAKAPAPYVCEKCCTVAMQPCKCSMCGGEMQKKHLLEIKDGTGYFCNCPADCKCTKQENDDSKCSCGKTITKASLKGMYICNCGPDCKCNTVSDKPGKCSCGTDLKKVE